MVGVYTIVKPAAEYGWGDPVTGWLGGLSLVLLAAFVIREATAASPLIPLRVFRSGTVSGANLIQALSISGMFGMFFLGSLYLERVLHYDALGIGLSFLPVTLIMAVLSIRYSERLVTRFGARSVLLAGLILITAGLALFMRAPVGGSYVWHVLPVMLLLGAGGGISFPALMTLAMSGATAEDAGLASGLINTTAQVGAALGLAVLATIAAARTGAQRATGTPEPDALTSGYHLAFGVGAVLLLASIAVAVTMLRRPARP